MQCKLRFLDGQQCSTRGRATNSSSTDYPLPSGASTRTRLPLAIATSSRPRICQRARAQMARDIVMARSIRPYVDRGVVLLAGNGHARRDIGVRFWLTTEEQGGAVSIGVLERNHNGSAPDDAADFDDYVITERAARN